MTQATTDESLTYEEAVRFINEDTAWPPHYKVEAETSQYHYWGSNNVHSRLYVTLLNSSVISYASCTYDEPWTLRMPLGIPEFAMRSKDALVHYILEKIAWCDEHETREFCRYKKADGTWHAPFHPHRNDPYDQHRTPEWLAQHRDPDDRFIAGRRPGKAASA